MNHITLAIKVSTEDDAEKEKKKTNKDGHSHSGVAKGIIIISFHLFTSTTRTQRVVW